MMKRKQRTDGIETREAILAAAEVEFAEKGYELASVRTICKAAGANVALANRYFGSKQELYKLVAQRLFGDLGAPLAEIPAKVKDAASWRAAVREWIDDMLFMTIPTERAQKLCAGLFRQEVTRPTEFFKDFMDAFGKPVYAALEKLIAMAVTMPRRVTAEVPDAPSRRGLVTAAIWSQVTIYALADEKALRPFRPKGLTRAAWRDAVAEHIAASVFAGISYDEMGR